MQLYLSGSARSDFPIFGKSYFCSTALQLSPLNLHCTALLLHQKWGLACRQLGYISFLTRLYQIGFLCSQSSGFVLSRLQLRDFFHGFNAVILLTQQPFNSPKCNHQHHHSKLPSTSFSSSSPSSAYSTKMINFFCNLFLILV